MSTGKRKNFSCVFSGFFSSLTGVFQLKGSPIGFQFPQNQTIFPQLIPNRATKIFVDRTRHCSTERSVQRLPCPTHPFCREDKLSLSNHHPVSSGADQPCPQIARKVIFPAPDSQQCYHPGKRYRAHRHPGNGHHQCAFRKKALAPGVFPGKRTPPVSFDITFGVLEPDAFSIYNQCSIHSMLHTGNAMAALHEWHQFKRAHDRHTQWLQRTKTKRSLYIPASISDRKHNTMRAEQTFSQNRSGTTPIHSCSGCRHWNRSALFAPQDL